MIDVLAPKRQSLRAFDSLHPHARFVWKNFAIPVGSYAAAWTVALVLRTAHRAGQPGFMQNALPAHPAIEQDLFADPFDRQE